jgi:hypothetical protein
MSALSTIKERPILFSGAMVRAILRAENPKTQTRRVMKVQPPEGTLKLERWVVSDEPQFRDSGIPLWISTEANGTNREYGCPYGDPSDRLWVRETWASLSGDRYAYKADVSDKLGKRPPLDADEKEGWKSSMFMPRKASRITLEVVSIRAERLQDISEEDAIAEGVPINQELPATINGEQGQAIWFGTGAIDLFARLWDSINGKTHPWKSNPWVWVVEFKRIEVKL